MIEGLNEIQSKAAETINGPVMVLACAGSGKTRTLTYRIINMIVNHNIDPFNILAITFTNKATNVMKERIRSYIDVNVGAITISTFHSLCAMILRKEAQNIGYDRSFEICDEEEQLKVINEVLVDLGFEKKRAKEFQKMINYNKCFMQKPLTNEEQLIYTKYEEKMKELNMLDFEDLLLKTYELFATNQYCLDRYQERFKYILVDEFQDTNLVQYEILKLLGLKYKNVFVVGDEDQSIYSFRGTNYENIQNFKKDFDVTNIFELSPNYRSQKKIIDYANSVIKNNKNRVRVSPMNPCDDKNVEHMDDVITYIARNEKDEVAFIIDKIEAMKTSLNEYSDFAVIYRSSVLLRNLELGLIRHKIPYKVYGGISYLKRKEIKDIIAYLKLMLNPNDTLSFKRIVNTPSRGIGLATIDKIETIKKQYRLNYLDAITWAESILPSNKYVLLKEFKELIMKYSKMLETDNLIEVFDNLVSEIKYFEYIKDEYEKDEAEDRLENLKEFKSILYYVETTNLEVNKIDRLKDAIDDAVLSDAYLQSKKEDIKGVTVSTIHSVKGMEFDTVFMMGMEENLFPSRMRSDNSADLEEERRIAYVGITRAKNKLFLTYTKERLIYGSYFKNQPSRFLLEAIGVNKLNEFSDASIVTSPLVMDIETQKIYEKRSQIATSPLTKDTTNDSTYNIGDTIIHKKFGEGIITGIENGIGTIFFTALKEQKKLLLSHPSISKK